MIQLMYENVGKISKIKFDVKKVTRDELAAAYADLQIIRAKY